MSARLLSCLVPAVLALTSMAACSEPAAPPAEEAEPVAGPETIAEAPAAPTLQQLWIAEGFEAPEGAAMAPDGNYFISSIRGEGTDKDGDGYVSKLSPDGELIEQYFAAKLNAPKGMVVRNGTLYVADIDQVVMFNAETGSRIGGVRVPEAGFLNDMTVWGNKVLVSDSATASIIDVSSGEPVVWLQDEENLAGVNGLLGDGNRLLVATMASGSLYSVSEAGELTEIASGMENADGIGLVPGGGYMLSSWPGQIHYVSEDGTVTTLVDTTEEGILQNDLTEFGDIVLSPNWEPGTVTAWKVVR